MAQPTVAQRLSQRRQGGQHVADLGPGDRQRLDAHQHGRDCLRQVGQDSPIDEANERRQVGQALGQVGSASSGGVAHCVAPHRRLNDPQRQIGPPLQLPQLSKRTRALPLGRRESAPGDVEQRQAVQQAAALQVRLLSQVEPQCARLRLRSQPQPGLLGSQVMLQRHRRHVGRHDAHALANDQPPTNEAHRLGVATTQNGLGRLIELIQCRERPPAQRRQRLGQSHRLDEMAR